MSVWSYVYFSKLVVNSLEEVQHIKLHSSSINEDIWASRDTAEKKKFTFLLCLGILTTLPVFPFFSKFATGVRISPDKDTSYSSNKRDISCTLWVCNSSSVVTKRKMENHLSSAFRTRQSDPVFFFTITILHLNWWNRIFLKMN